MLDRKRDGEIYTVVLSCLHTLQFQKPIPRPGELVWCKLCDQYKKSVVPPESYRVECRDCTRAPTKDYGRAVITAELAADKHAGKHPGHRVKVMNGPHVVSERMHAEDNSLLDALAPPF